MAVNVHGADFTDALTADSKAAAVDWQSAKVPPAELPATVPPPPPWVPAVILGGVLLLVFLLLRRRRA